MDFVFFTAQMEKVEIEKLWHFQGFFHQNTWGNLNNLQKCRNPNLYHIAMMDLSWDILEVSEKNLCQVSHEKKLKFESWSIGGKRALIRAC